MYRRALVDPLVLESDFESHEDINSVEQIAKDLSHIETMRDFWKYNDQTTSETDDGVVLNKLRVLWTYTKNKWGANLRDREKLYPIFKELNRLVGGKDYPIAYRRVVVPEVYGKKFLSLNFVPEMPLSPKVEQVLENLAYGLRSWSSIPFRPQSLFREKQEFVIFVYKNPDVVLDGDTFIQRTQYYGSIVQYELVLFVKNPKILNVQQFKNVFLVTITD